jgi:hypothetical protein
MKKILFSFVTVALAVSSAASSSFHVNIDQPTWVGGTQLKPGDYKVALEGDKAMIKVGKTMVEVPAKVENADKKFDATSVRVDSVNNKQSLKEIRVGGTTMRVLFTPSSAAGE